MVENRLRAWRLQQGWTQTDLAKKLGEKPYTISKLEKGTHHASPPLAKRIEKLSRGWLTVAELVTGEYLRRDNRRSA